MRETVFLGLNSFIKLVFHIGFLVITFYAFEAIDYAKFIRKNFYHRGILIHTLLSIAVSYLVTQFFLMILFK